MIDRIKLVEMIRRSPGVRTMQLCDLLDENIDVVEIALASELIAGAIVQHDVTAPNGRQAVAFTLAGVPLPRQLPMADTNTSVKGKADNPEAAPQAMPTKALTNVEKAIAFIKEQPDQTATSAQLHMALNLKAADVPSQYLGNALKDGRLVKDGKNWTLGPAARAAGNDAPVAQKPVPVAGKPASLAKDTGTVSANTPVVPEKAASVSGKQAESLVTAPTRTYEPASIEAAKDISMPYMRLSPITPNIPTVTNDRDVDHVPNFLVALLSNSNIEIRIDGQTITLTKARWSHMREFINKVELA